MSGVDFNSSDWSDQLSEVRGTISRRSRRSEVGGYVPNRHKRRPRKPKERPQNPFEGVQFKQDEITEVVDARSEDEVGTRVPKIFEVGSVNKQDLCIDICGTGDEAHMGKYVDSPFSSGDDRNRARTFYEDQQDYEDEELSEEELAEIYRVKKSNARTKKTIIRGIALIGTLAVTTCGFALVSGLLGRHRSNIMNM
jgi:hypothetical protein